MATRINAWKARDGSIHESEEAAKRSDLRAALWAIPMLDELGHPVIESIIFNAKPVYDALTMYMARFQQKVP